MFSGWKEWKFLTPLPPLPPLPDDLFSPFPDLLPPTEMAPAQVAPLPAADQVVPLPPMESGCRWRVATMKQKAVLAAIDAADPSYDPTAKKAVKRSRGGGSRGGKAGKPPAGKPTAPMSEEVRSKWPSLTDDITPSHRSSTFRDILCTIVSRARNKYCFDDRTRAGESTLWLLSDARSGPAPFLSPLRLPCLMVHAYVSTGVGKQGDQEGVAQAAAG